MTTYTVSRDQVKNFLLARSALHSKFASLTEYFDSYTCIQVDPIDVVAKSHELALYNRVHEFKRKQLDQALYDEHTLCEYWMQLYSILPTKFFPYLTARMHSTDSWHADFKQQHQKELKQAYQYIQKHGPTSSLDLAHIPKTSSLGSWGDNKSNTALLRFLWDRGVIMVNHRQGNRKYFDLTTRILPTKLQQQKVTLTQSLQFLYQSAFNYLGIIRTPYLNRFGYQNKLPLKQMLIEDLKKGDVLQLTIPQINTKYYLLKRDLKSFQKLSQTNPHTEINILPPLDPLVIDRQMLADIFQFIYRWEAYTPAKKRQYGFYNMPILYQGNFVGQINLRNENGKLHIKNFHADINSPNFKQVLKAEISSIEVFVKT